MGVQTDLQISDLDRMEDRINDMENKLKDTNEALRKSFVEKVTATDTSVKSYLALPSITALYGIFGMKFNKLLSFYNIKFMRKKEI